MFQSIKKLGCVAVTAVTGYVIWPMDFRESRGIYENSCNWDERFLRHMAWPWLKCEGSCTLDSWHDLSQPRALARKSLPDVPSSFWRWTRAHKRLQSLLTVCISLFFFFSVPLCSFTHDIPKQLSKMRDIISVTHEKTAVMDSLNAFIAFWTLESPGQCHKSPRWPSVPYSVWDSLVRPACV